MSKVYLEMCPQCCHTLSDPANSNFEGFDWMRYNLWPTCTSLVITNRLGSFLLVFVGRTYQLVLKHDVDRYSLHGFF
jgi:hypothetical protein